MNKEYIIANVGQFTANDLYAYIAQGIISFDELLDKAGANLSFAVYRELDNMIRQYPPQPQQPQQTQQWQQPQQPQQWQQPQQPQQTQQWQQPQWQQPQQPEPQWEQPRQQQPEPQWEQPRQQQPEPQWEQPRQQQPEPQWEQPRQQQPEPQENYYYNQEPQSIFEEWDLVDKTSDEALFYFIQQHPGHPMIPEANRLRNELYRASLIPRNINSLKQEVNNIMTNKNVLDKNTKIFDTIRQYIQSGFTNIQELLYVIADDNNFLSAHVVNMLIDAGYITYMDLVSAGINPQFIDQLVKGSETTYFTTPMPIEKVNKVSTEIYFWGIPSSGKTCALGGILSMANNGRIARTMSQDNDCQGYGYMTRLANVFRENHGVGTLPPGTGIYDIWEMGFNLEDQEGHIHPITCIDLAGELVRCMYKHDAGEPLTDDELMTLETVTNLLISNRTQNRKMHFFVLEYGGEQRQYEGLDQSTYLSAALEYIKRTRIFNNETDAIFLLFTKVDKAKLRGQALVDHLREYTDRYYANFYNGLVDICQTNEINGGKVERIPFTLGNVCFQNYCIFNGTTAENVVRKILERTKGFKRTKFQNFLNKAQQ